MKSGQKANGLAEELEAADANVNLTGLFQVSLQALFSMPVI